MIADVRQHRFGRKGTSADLAGTGRPEIAISESSPAVLSTTVLPPALAPEMIMAEWFWSNENEDGIIVLVSEVTTPSSLRDATPPSKGGELFDPDLRRFSSNKG